VYFAGRAEEAAALVHRRLGGLVVRDAMTPIADPLARLTPIAIRENDPLESAVEQLATAPNRMATVLNNSEEVVGVLLATSPSCSTISSHLDCRE
jgi:hypothetical protein